jgi:hypothetical protein
MAQQQQGGGRRHARNQRLAEQRAQVTARLRGMGDHDHSIDLERGVAATVNALPLVSTNTSSRGHVQNFVGADEQHSVASSTGSHIMEKKLGAGRISLDVDFFTVFIASKSKV